MEAKQQNKKLTYEELSQKFGELFAQYQKATAYIQKLESAMNENSFNQTSFFISMLFKVMDHPEQYNPDFVKWASENIESALREFASAFSAPEKEEDKEEDKEKPSR